MSWTAEIYTTLSQQRTRLENRRLLIRSPDRPIFFPSIDDSHSSLTAVYCLDNGYVRKQLET